MTLPNIILLNSTQGVASITGTPKRAGAAYRSSGGLYTVSILSHNLIGRVYLEGTLASNPVEEDWFAIPMPNLDTPYIEYPNSSSPITGGSQNIGFSFKGNLVWIRARLDRDYLQIQEGSSIAPYGYIDQVVLNTGTWLADQGLPEDDPTIIGGEGVVSVRGNNLGTGEGLYVRSHGQSNVLLSFKTIREGENVRIDTTESEIIISSLGGGDGGSTSPTRFVNLLDTPNVITPGLVFGRNDRLEMLNNPTGNGQFLRWNGTNLYWSQVEMSAEVKVQKNGEDETSSHTLNFGDGLLVENVDGVTTIRTAPTSNLSDDQEYVEFQYTAGNSGNLSASDAIISKTGGVSVTIVDPINCIVAFTFTGRNFPPSSIAMMGQAQPSNEFNYATVGGNIATRKIAGGGTSDNPTMLGNFAGPVTLQLRMADVGASASVGRRAKAVVMFKF